MSCFVRAKAWRGLLHFAIQRRREHQCILHSTNRVRIGAFCIPKAQRGLEHFHPKGKIRIGAFCTRMAQRELVHFYSEGLERIVAFCTLQAQRTGIEKVSAFQPKSTGWIKALCVQMALHPTGIKWRIFAPQRHRKGQSTFTPKYRKEWRIGFVDAFRTSECPHLIRQPIKAKDVEERERERKKKIPTLSISFDNIYAYNKNGCL